MRLDQEEQSSNIEDRRACHRRHRHHRHYSDRLKVTTQLQRIETVPDLLFLDRPEAEEFAFKLCKSWIDSETKRNH